MKTVISICLLIVSAFITSNAAVVPERQPALVPADVKFLKAAGQASLNEVKVATLGTQKSQNPALKDLAAALVADHTTALEKAKALAAKKDLSISTAIDEDTAKTYKDLERKTGNEFDTAFIAYLDQGHIKSIKSFEEAQKTCQDPELKAWIDETLPLIKAHHERIKKLK